VERKNISAENYVDIDIDIDVDFVVVSLS